MNPEDYPPVLLKYQQSLANEQLNRMVAESRLETAQARIVQLQSEVERLQSSSVNSDGELPE